MIEQNNTESGKKISLSQKCESLRGILTKTKCKLYVAFVNHTYAWGHYSQQHSIYIPPMRLPRGSGPAPASMVHWSPRVQFMTTQTTHTSKQLLVFTKFPLLGFFCNDIGSQIIIWNSLMILTIATTTEIWGTLDDTANYSNMAWWVLEGERGGWQTQSKFV